MAIVVGAQAPDFTLPGWYQRSESHFTLSTQRGRPVVLVFYPGDDRIVCTRQLSAYSENLADLQMFDAVVWGISSQGLESHREFAQGHQLKMPLLVDEGHEVARKFAIMGPLGLRRSVFIVDAGGRITWRRVTALNITFPGVSEIRAALASLRSAA